MCICVHIYIYPDIQVYIYTIYIHTYIHTYIQTYIHTYIQTYIHACVCARVYVCARAWSLKTHMQAHTRPHHYTYMYMYAPLQNGIAAAESRLWGVGVGHVLRAAPTWLWSTVLLSSTATSAPPVVPVIAGALCHGGSSIRRLPHC